MYYYKRLSAASNLLITNKIDGKIFRRRPGVLTVFFIFTLHLVNKLLLQDMARSIRYFFILLFTVVAGSAYAQAPGSIQGTVLDETNQPVIGALIEAFEGGIKKG